MAWRDLYSYWRDRHVDGRPPSRAEIDPPLDIPRLLPNLLLFDRVGENFRMRLSGSELTRRGGRNDAGRIMDPAVITDRGIPTLVTFLHRVADTRQPMIYSVGRGDDTAFGAIGILLPLVGMDDRVEMILGGVFYRATGSATQAEPWNPNTLTELSLPQMLEQDAEVFR